MGTITKAVLKTALATGAFAAIHSLLASRAAKRKATSLIGKENADGFYRIAYIAQSFATGSLLLCYLRRQPAVDVYKVQGTGATLMYAVQAIGLLHATAAARQVGILRITGLENIAAWIKGAPVPPMPEAQGPGLTRESTDRAAGPFAWSRHPLNFSPVVILWLWPRMNSTLLTFNLCATAYLIIGSVHEEKRLLESEGDDYEAYRLSGVPFYWPSLSRSPRNSISQVGQDALYTDAT